jgi:DNA polymerase I-like protein with 3'-5' exonuclease and polymerase domains
VSGENERRLLDHHRERLEVASALSPEVIAARGYYSVQTRDELPVKGFPAELDRFLPGLAIPLFGVRRLDPGEQLEPTGLVLRPDTLYEARDGSARKYLNPAKQRNVLDVHPSMHEFLLDRDVPLIITEGTIKADAAASIGLLAVSLAGVDSGRRDHADHPDWDRIALKVRQILIAYDSDVTIKPSVRGALARLVGFLRRSGARSVEVVRFLPGEQGRKVGLDDFLAAHRGSTHPIGLLLEHAVELDDVPDGEAPAPPELPAELTGADVLEGLCDLLRRYIRFKQEEEAWAVALWIAHTHFVSVFELVPYLAVSSAVFRCGKTHLLDLARWASARGKRMSAASDASIFRSLAVDSPPTLFFDEVDNYIGESTDRAFLIGVLNEGFEVGGVVTRVEETNGKQENKDFRVFGPKAFTGIGKILPATTLDRSIRIRLERRLRSERIAKWRHRRVKEQAEGVRGLLAGWAAADTERVQQHYDSDLEFAVGTNERAEDLWEPLLAVAEAAGGEWPVRARRAARELTPSDDDSTELSLILLADIRRVFAGAGTPEVLKSGELRDKLNALEEAPWGGLRDGKGLSTNRLAAMLAEFGAAPERGYPESGGPQIRGWWRASLEPIWERFLPGPEASQSDSPISTNQSVLVSQRADPSLNQAVFEQDTLVPEGAPLRSKCLSKTPVNEWFETPRHSETPKRPKRRIGDASEAVVDGPLIPVPRVVDEPAPLIEVHTQTIPVGDGPQLRVELVPPEQPERRELFRNFLNASQRAGAVLGVDCETTGKDPHAPGFEVRLWSVSDGQTAYVVDHRDERSRELVHELLRRFPRLVFHGGYVYDLPVAVRELGLDVGDVSRRARELKLVDSMILSRLVHPEAKRVGLKEMSVLHFGDGAADPERLLKRSFRSMKTNWATVSADHPAYWGYAGCDAALTQRLHGLLRSEAGTPWLLELEHRVAAICLRAGLRGFAVDEQAAKRLEQRLAGEEGRLEQALAACGVVKIATDAGRASIMQALEREGLSVENSHFDKAALAPLAVAGSAVARDVMALRTAAKFRALYARMFGKALEQDGRLHAYARSLAASTGRMAMSRVPLQTAPKEIQLAGDLDHAGRLAVRDVLVADRRHVIATADFTAMELRLACALSGDANLRQVVEAGDPHTAVARSLFNTEVPTEKQRAIAKTTNFGVMYGMGVESLTVRLGVTPEQAHAFLDGWWKRFPTLERYASTLSDVDRTPWGRRLPVNAPRHARLNHRIQAAGRDVFATGLLRLEDAGLVDHLALPLHDEYVLAVPESGAHELVARVARTVSSELGGVPLPVEANVGGRSWGSAK